MFEAAEEKKNLQAAVQKTKELAFTHQRLNEEAADYIAQLIICHKVVGK